MKTPNRLLFALALTLALRQSIATECPFDSGSISILGNDFPATQAVAQTIRNCTSDGKRVRINLTSRNKELQVAALTTQPARYSAALVGNSALVPLISKDLVRPLDDLIERHGKKLTDSQRITYNGETLAVAFLANAQHLFFREDILAEAGLSVPQTYNEVLVAAKTIREKDLLQYPIAATYETGWNLALEFVNFYLSTGNTFFETGSSVLSIEAGAAKTSLQMMKSLSEYMNPDFLTYDPNTLQSEWEAGQVALANLWGSRAAAVLDTERVSKVVAKNTAFSNAPSLVVNGPPSSTLWWVGFAIAKNISDEDADATFRAFMYALSPELMDDHNDKAVWLVENYQPDAAAIGTYQVIESNTPSYPSQPYMNLLHTALGREIPDFLKGSESLDQTLIDIEAAYETAAREAGYLQ